MRSSGRKSDDAPSLFPFLAVLVCTMGVLIVLLVVLVQQARVEASQAINPAPSAAETADLAADQVSQEDLARAIEDAAWRAEMLRNSREQTASQLVDHRLELSHLESDLREREDRATFLREQIRQLAPVDDEATYRDLEADRRELAHLTAQQAILREQIEQAQREATDQEQSFALIPYNGPSGTQRRPIYIECLSDRVILQPEGIELFADDFREPIGPNNPLASALRAIRQYLARTGQLAPGEEPYPLLIVRPSGPISYTAARGAMNSWDAEFGYELVEAEVKLAYPEPEPTLVAELTRVVEQARQVQSDLARAAPRRYGRSGGQSGEGLGAAGMEEVVGVAPSFAGNGRGSIEGDAAEGSSQQPGQGAADNSSDQDTLPLSPFGSGSDSSEQHVNGENSLDTPGSGVAGGTEAQGSSIPSLAGTRGSNWALPQTAARATGFTRPIHVEVLADRLVIHPERGSRQLPIVVEAPGPLRDSIDSLVSALWDHMDQWGTAGDGAYWKPVLNVEVAPGAQHRYEVLSQLLRGSGMNVTRRSP